MGALSLSRTEGYNIVCLALSGLFILSTIITRDGERLFTVGSEEDTSALIGQSYTLLR